MVLERTKGPFTLSSVANLRFDAEYFFRSEKVFVFKKLCTDVNSTGDLGRIVQMLSQCIVGNDNDDGS